VTPSLSARWAVRDVAGFRHRMAFGLRGILAIIIPSAVGMLLLARPLIDLVLDHGAETGTDAHSTAAALAMFALGLPGFCTFLYMVRVFQAMQDTRTAFKLYVVENAVNIVFGVLLVGPLGVRGLALSVSIAYSVAALLAMAVVRQRIGGLGGDDLTTPVKRVLGASAVMAVATVLALNVSGSNSGWGLLGRVVLALVVGSVAYVAAATVLGARHARRNAEARPPGPRATSPRPQGSPASGSGASSTATPPSASGTDDSTFRDRIGQRAERVPYRHLRPLGGALDPPGPVDAPPVERDEEDVDDPDPGDNR